MVYHAKGSWFVLLRKTGEKQGLQHGSYWTLPKMDANVMTGPDPFSVLLRVALGECLGPMALIIYLVTPVIIPSSD